MIEYFSTDKDSGWEYAEKTARELQKQGYEILDIIETIVPRGENADGKIYFIPGYRIVADNGREPRYRGCIYSKTSTGSDSLLVNENLQDPPGVNSEAPWLWD